MLGFAALAEVAIAEIPGLPKPIGWVDEWDRPRISMAKFELLLRKQKLYDPRSFEQMLADEMLEEQQRERTNNWYESSVVAMKERRRAFLARQRGR